MQLWLYYLQYSSCLSCKVIGYILFNVDLVDAVVPCYTVIIADDVFDFLLMMVMMMS